MGLFTNMGQFNSGMQQVADRLDPGRLDARTAAWNTFNPNNLQGNLSPELLKYGGMSPDGRYQIAGQYEGGNAEFGDPGKLVGYNLWDMQNTGAGKPFYNFDADGKYVGTRTGASVSPSLALIPLAAALGMGALGAGLGGGAAAGGAGGAAGSGAGFVGEGALSGIGAWDGALAGATPGFGAGGAAGFIGEGATSGVPAWDGIGASTSTMGAGASPNIGSLIKSGATSLMGGSGGVGSLLGPAATALGALAGGQGQNASQSSTRSMDPRMDSLFYGDLAPRTQGLLAANTPSAQTAGNQMLTKGSGLLGQTAPTTATNPYLKSIADDMQRRTLDLLGQNNLAIQGNAVGVGGLGGSRQGVAQGLAASRAADTLQGQVAGLYGNAYETDQNRLRQDWTLGAGLMNQGINTPFLPAQNTAQIYSPFTGFGTTTQNASQGGGWQGALGGALGAAQLGKNAGWW